MIQKPDISIVITSINVNINYFQSCISSLLDQTFRNFEIIIVLEPLNKNSLKNLEYIKNKYKDYRILYYILDKKMGFSDCLNYGIRKSRAKYIARMDIDDICVVDRLEQQFNFMEKNHNCIVCGSYMKTFGKSEKIIKTEKYNLINRFVKLLFCKTPILHPTAFIRKNAFDLVSYSNQYKAEDYRFWIDLAIKTDMEFSNIPKVLVKYRVHKNQSSTLNKEFILKEIIDNCIYYLKSLNLDISNDDILFHKGILDGSIELNFKTKSKIKKHLKTLKIKIENKYCIKIPNGFYNYVWYCIFHHFNKFSFLGFLSYLISPYFSFKFIFRKTI